VRVHAKECTCVCVRGKDLDVRVNALRRYIHVYPPEFIDVHVVFVRSADLSAAHHVVHELMCVYVCEYIYIHVCMCVSIYIHVCVRVCVYLSI
jgi:hypothetical protein